MGGFSEPEEDPKLDASALVHKAGLVKEASVEADVALEIIGKLIAMLPDRAAQLRVLTYVLRRLEYETAEVDDGRQ